MRISYHYIYIYIIYIYWFWNPEVWGLVIAPKLGEDGAKWMRATGVSSSLAKLGARWDQQKAGHVCYRWTIHLVCGGWWFQHNFNDTSYNFDI
jgi:hypothetical protein